MPKYGEAQYWEDRYQKSSPSETFEWLESWESLKELIEGYTVVGLAEAKDEAEGL